MNQLFIFTTLGALLCGLGLYAVIIQAHILRKVMALNIIGSGVFMIIVALSDHGAEIMRDPVPHAMVLTGIVVAVSATALALALMIKHIQLSQQTDLQ